MNVNEIWKRIENFPNYYVSNLGNVKSSHSGNLLKPTLAGGYPQVGLYLGPIQTKKKVHRLVAEAFISNPDNLNQVNHIDGVKTNNIVSNLEWCNSGQNQVHAFRLGLKHPVLGTKHGRSKLNEQQVIEIRRLLETTKLSGSKIGNMFNVAEATIRRIRLRINWRHI